MAFPKTPSELRQLLSQIQASQNQIRFSVQYPITLTSITGIADPPIYEQIFKKSKEIFAIRSPYHIDNYSPRMLMDRVIAELTQSQLNNPVTTISNGCCTSPNCPTTIYNGCVLEAINQYFQSKL